MHKLNQHLLYFLRKIRFVNKSARFAPENFFHPKFLNAKNKIAPNKKENKLLTVKFKAFFEKFRKLDRLQKEEFYNVVIFSRGIQEYFENDQIDVNILHASNIFRIIGDNSFSDLMSALWDNLKSNSWEIDKHYEDIFENVPPSKTCPFCGIQQLANPKSFRADYDHLAYKGNYPLSAINLQNLAPSCSECNQKYKHSQDVFYSDIARLVRRPYNYLYKNSINIKIDFTNTILPNTDHENTSGTWELNILPSLARVSTWKEIYDIERRYVDDVLLVHYNVWIYEFLDEYKGQNILSDDELRLCFIKQFKRYNYNRLQKTYLLKSSLYRYFFKCKNKVFYDQLIKQLN